MTDHSGEIHSEHPFATPKENRDPVRRFRGRLAAPVTVWTAASEDAGGRCGLTISSVVVADGDPALVLGLVNDLTDLWRGVTASGAFVVHVLDVGQRALAERFALLRPAPGGLFAGLAVSTSAWGPVLDDVPTRAYCRLVDTAHAGHQRLIRGRLEDVEIADDFDDPLVHFRGRFNRLDGT